MTGALAERLARWSPRRYGLRPTPLHRLDRFSAAIGREVWIKRDDLISVGVGGNKIRKLGYLVADALAQRADHLVTVGAGQSNHARCVAAVAAMEGLGCDLVLGGPRDAPVVGNLLLDRLFGAEVHFPGTDDWEALEGESAAVAESLRGRGRRPYVMPIGGSTPVGALGFVEAFLELSEQLAESGVAPTAIVHATSSGGTQAGLAIGAAVTGSTAAIVGVGVAKTARHLEGEIVEIAAGCCDLLSISPAGLQVAVTDGFRGPAYGESTPGSTDALLLLARREGIIVDPVYTAKALHAVVEASDGVLGAGPVVFWHTGGLPAVFAPELAAHLLRR